MYFLGFAVALMTTIGAVTGIDYCNKRLCNYRRHIACENDGSFDPICPLNAHIIDIEPCRELILNMHNEVRNLIAGGGLIGYETAIRMATMQWDKTLAELAIFTVKHCQLRLDSCRNTQEYRNVGQNIHTKIYGGPARTFSDLEITKELINTWFDEYKRGAGQYIRSYPGRQLAFNFQHFLLLVVQHNIRIGCAAVRFRRESLNHLILACNYATNNVIGKPTYVRGKPAAGCKTGANPDYAFLCSVNETYEALYDYW